MAKQCPHCGGEWGVHRPDCSQVNRPLDYLSAKSENNITGELIVANAKLQQENERLRDLLKQAAAELAEYIHAEHVSRHRYPDMQRRYERDMRLVREINIALRDQTNEP